MPRAEGDPIPYLYILMRSDLSSLNPGKAMAQAAHAANDAVVKITNRLHIPEIQQMYDDWRWDETNQLVMTFGTTIVIDGVDEQTIVDVTTGMNHSAPSIRFHGTIVDPTYPVRDGRVTHYIPLLTCGWVFCYKGDEVWNNFSNKYQLRLHK